MQKKDIFIIIGVIVLVGLVFGINVLSNNKKEKESKENLLSGKYYVQISVKDYGDIKLELDADTAPITVTNFINLVKDKYYDGLTFHRIIKNFMIQGGASNKDAKTIKGEFTNNGVKNNISHVRGVISMARVDGYNDSASTQFFIMHKDNTSLDGNYAAFGHVIEGMDVVDKIANVTPMEDTNGIVSNDMQPVIEKIFIIDGDK